MVLNLNKNLKLYYSIGEVAKMFNINESTLRYWEKEFPTLKPKTSGPSMILNTNPSGTDKTAEILTRLTSIKNELQLLKQQLDGTFA